MYNYVEFFNRYVIPVMVKDYAIVFNAIHTGLKTFTGNYVIERNVEFSFSVLLDGACINDKKW